ncbi:TlpA family protein disulfide reductase [Mucilaginibacter sp.]|uniref:TlpA family protein disulfide reductase n=1 Tax=Mucilaginibacter sp. TaxID=1882438 RepID=UPI003D100773
MSYYLYSCFFTSAKINAQKANVNIITTGYQGNVDVFDPAVNYNPKDFISIIPVDKNGKAVYTTDVSSPRYIVIYFNLPGNMQIPYCLFLSTGNDLSFKILFTNNIPKISVSGKGSNNNQPEIFALTNPDLTKFKGDVLPNRVIAYIKTQEGQNKIILKQYIKKYKPSAAFIKNALINNQYFALNNYYEFYHYKYLPFTNNPEHDQWQRVEDSLLAKHKLNNDDALTAYNYDHFIGNFLIQEGPILRSEELQQPAKFYRDFYQTTVKKGRVIYAAESRNLFFESIINKYFTGKTRERVYAQMLRFHLRFNHYEDLELVYRHFKSKYPSSSYIPIFSSAIAEIVTKEKQTLNSNMVFVTDNGTKLNTLEDVVHLMKGRTTFVDMWGTWCGPCRIELEKFTPQIREHFKGKGIAFLYIANNDSDHKEQWKKVIEFYKIEGIHILANEHLNNDIMTKIKCTGYPSHFIIKKDGSILKTKIQDEAQTQELIKEIEASL